MQFTLTSHTNPASHWQGLWPSRVISAETGECNQLHLWFALFTMYQLSAQDRFQDTRQKGQPNLSTPLPKRTQQFTQ